MANDFFQSNVKQRFQSYLSSKVPQKLTSVLWQLFNGTIAILDYLDTKINFYIRERNLLTATQKTSLRALAASNGFEPSLKVPAQGVIKLEINQQLYSSYGSPLFLPPYSVFTCKENNLEYYFNSDKVLKLSGYVYEIPVVEGQLKTDVFNGTADFIQKIYIKETNVSENSIVVTSNGQQFVQVKSFYDNEGFNNDLQFVVKHSNDSQNPIVVYLKGTEENNRIDITYRLSFGELGNLESKCTFETEDIITSNSTAVETKEENFKCYNVSGFSYGSNGTDENALRAAIGYNHGSALLFDNTSYRNFLSKFSSLLIQDVKVDETERSINNIYLSKKQVLVDGTITDIALIPDFVVDEYKRVIQNGKYMLTQNNKDELSKILDEYEFCLSTHHIHDSQVAKYALQIKFDNLEDKTLHESVLSKIIYFEFSKFLYNKSYTLDLDKLLKDYMVKYNVSFDFYIFCDVLPTNQNLSSNVYLPILKGDFEIKTGIYLFNDINFVIKD